MRAQFTAGTTRRRQRTLAAALGFVLAIAAVVIPSAPASAMTQVGTASGTPGSSVQAVVQNQSAGFGTWTITAPPNTTITFAQSVPAPGLGQFTCAPVNGGQQANCGTSTWGVNNQVAITLTIAAGADAPQTVQGTSVISGLESGTYSVGIVPPAAPGAPTITAPAAGSESVVTQPTITGTKAAGNAATVTLDDQAPCTIPADAATTWNCPAPSEPLAVGTHTVTATQTDRFGQTSPVATSTFTVLAPAAFSITQSGATELLPTREATHTITIDNTGDGEARDVTFTADLGGFPATACAVDGTAVDCAALPAGIALGSLAPGASVVVTVTGAAPAGTAPGTTYAIATSTVSSTDPDSPVASSATLEVVPLNAPVFTSPTAGSTTTNPTPVIRGAQAVEGAVVTVFQGPTAMCTATADRGGLWSCTPSPRFAYGAVNITASQTYGGLTSGRATLGFTVRQAPVTPAPPTTQPGGSAPAPGTPSAPAGGGSTPTGGSGAPGGSGTNGSGGNAGAGAGSATPSTPSAPPTSAPGNGSGDGGSGSGGGNGSGTGTSNGALPMDLRFGTQRIMPGTAADMRGTLGPNASGATVAITFSARMSTGMVYRNVDVEVDEEPVDCSVATTRFSCLIPLDPGKQADVAIRVFADAVNAPDTAVQQIQVASNRSSQANAMTVTTAVAKGETEASQLADQITAFNVTEFPGAMVPLLAMLLFALAATVAGRRATGGSPTAPVATGPPPGADPPGGTTASSPIRPDDQSGSNR